MTAPLVLSLFPGIGLLDRAFEEEGFCVVRGPDLLWGGDVRAFHPPAGRFDGVIGGPPCQAFSRLRHLVEHNGYTLAPDLIPEFVRCVRESQPAWFVMENVPDAPLPVGTGYSVVRELLRDVWVGGVTNRLRAFTFGTRERRATRISVEVMALHRQDAEPAPLAGKGTAIAVAIGGSGKRKRTADTSALASCRRNAGVVREHARKQGLPPDFLDDTPFTVEGKIKMLGNGVPLPMGRAVARAVKRAMYPELAERAS